MSAEASAKWITVRLALDDRPGAKTRRWDVLTKGDEKDVRAGIRLGSIRWWGRWRRYAFFPEAGTLYESTCLRDIAAFLDQVMKARLVEPRKCSGCAGRVKKTMAGKWACPKCEELEFS